jgi:hypothetical protein
MQDGGTPQLAEKCGQTANFNHSFCPQRNVVPLRIITSPQVAGLSMIFSKKR